MFTPQVRPQPDGVHVHVSNETDRPLYVVAVHGLPDEDVDPGEAEVVGQIPPGDARIACYPVDAAQPTASQWERITVVDPEGLWRSPEIECRGNSGGSLTVDYIPGPDGAYDDPIEAARERLTVRPTDVVERARYPEETRHGAVRVVRDGRVVATAVFSHLDQGWFFDGGDFCTDEIRPKN